MTADNEVFQGSWRKIVLENYPELALDKWGSFLGNWFKSLSCYDTSIDFVVGTEIIEDKIEVNQNLWDALFVNYPNNFRRKELMKKQKNYEFKLRLNEYEIRVDKSCKLCENIMQAIDTKEEEKTNLIFEDEIGMVLPNKYPSQPGHSLYILKNHDNLEKRVLKNKIISDFSKTKGALIMPETLYSLIKICDENKLMAFRNHAMDSMSIKYHEHFHIYPDDLASNKLAKKIYGFGKETKYGIDIFRPEHTPFDTIAIINTNRDYFFEKTSEIINNLEKNNQIFTLAYFDKKLLILPRLAKNVFSDLGTAAGVPVHRFPSKDIKYLKKINKHIPLIGEYSWNKYV